MIWVNPRYNDMDSEPCSVCGARRLSRRGDRRLVGRALAAGVNKLLGGLDV